MRSVSLTASSRTRNAIPNSHPANFQPRPGLLARKRTVFPVNYIKCKTLMVLCASFEPSLATKMIQDHFSSYGGYVRIGRSRVMGEGRREHLRIVSAPNRRIIIPFLLGLSDGGEGHILDFRWESCPLSECRGGFSSCCFCCCCSASFFYSFPSFSFRTSTRHNVVLFIVISGLGSQ